MNTVRTSSKSQYPELRGREATLRYPAWAEPKLDGEFNWLIKDSDGCYTVNKRGLRRSECPATQCFEANPNVYSVQLIGELYWPPGHNGALYDLLRHQKDDGLVFKPFDIVELNGVSLTKHMLKDRIDIMFNRLNIVPEGKIVKSHEHMQQFFNKQLSLGYEGIVVKNLDSNLVFGPCSWVKLKKKDQNDYPIVYIDPTLERIEVLVKTDTTSKNVGVKVPNKAKFKLQKGDIARIEHQGILSTGGLRHPVYLGINYREREYGNERSQRQSVNGDTQAS